MHISRACCVLWQDHLASSSAVAATFSPPPPPARPMTASRARALEHASSDIFGHSTAGRGHWSFGPVVAPRAGAVPATPSDKGK